MKINIRSGTLEALKWLGLLSMTLDHFNRFFLNGRCDLFYSIGRLAMPLFAFVFAYNLARFEQSSFENYDNTFKKLIFFGLLATPAYAAMNGLHGFLPLNIMFTFFVAIMVLFFYEQEQPGMLLSLSCFLIGGMLVEYSWAGILLVIGFWSYCKKPSFITVTTILGAYGLLYWVNENNDGMLSLIIIIFATRVNLKIPRARYFFWIYYPVHLTVFYLIQ